MNQAATPSTLPLLIQLPCWSKRNIVSPHCAAGLGTLDRWQMKHFCLPGTAVPRHICCLQLYIIDLIPVPSSELTSVFTHECLRLEAFLLDDHSSPDLLQQPFGKPLSEVILEEWSQFSLGEGYQVYFEWRPWLRLSRLPLIWIPRRIIRPYDGTSLSRDFEELCLLFPLHDIPARLRLNLFSEHCRPLLQTADSIIWFITYEGSLIEWFVPKSHSVPVCPLALGDYIIAEIFEAFWTSEP